MISPSTPLPSDPRSVSRRRFLQAAGLAGGVAMIPSWMADVAAAATPVGPGDGILVLITMGGGNDGLNTVIPVQNGTYYDKRGSLAIPASGAHRLTDDRALHPNLGGLASLWAQGDLAVIDGVGNSATDLSHFSSMARVMAGGSNSHGFHSGWLGRYIDGLPGGDDPFHGVSIGSSVPLVVQGRHRQASGLPSDPDGVFEVAGADATYRRQYDAVAALGHGSTGRGELADALADSGGRAIDLAASIEGVYGHEQPEDPLAAKLDLCARLINANVGIRVLSVIYGDFDSHADQPPMHDARMAELDAGIQAFHARLHDGYKARTLVLTVSEFGRRVKANRSNGTDHGAAGTLLAVGPQVKGGFYGELPSLTDLDRQGNLKPKVDFRSVYATVLDTWLAADSGEVLGGAHENLGFLAAPAPNRTTSGLNPTAATSIFKRRAEVVRLYKACFGRLPDSGGLDHWVAARRSAVRLIDVAAAFTSSTEFMASYGQLSNGAFVDRLYQNVLGRGPDADGLAHWTGVLDRGSSRGSVVVGFSESNEFIAASAADVAHVDHNGPVARLYLAYFLRHPEDDGLRHWIASGLSYQAMSEAFAASDEFRRRYGSLGNGEFVDLIYQNVLGRAADAPGRAHWLAALDGGTGRGRMMLSFSESDEFIASTGTLR